MATAAPDTQASKHASDSVSETLPAAALHETAASIQQCESESQSRAKQGCTRPHVQLQVRWWVDKHCVPGPLNGERLLLQEAARWVVHVHSLRVALFMLAVSHDRRKAATRLAACPRAWDVLTLSKYCRQHKRVNERALAAAALLAAELSGAEPHLQVLQAKHLCFADVQHLQGTRLSQRRVRLSSSSSSRTYLKVGVERCTAQPSAHTASALNSRHSNADSSRPDAREVEGGIPSVDDAQVCPQGLAMQ